MPEKTFYLMRHAQPDYPNGEKMCLGQKNDLPLSEYGFAQAAMLSRMLRSMPIEAVYTSPLLRARQTAAHIAGEGRPLYVLDDLIELCGGEWDGLTFAELHKRYPHYFVHGSGFSNPPGGETDEHGLARARSALAQIERQTESCAALVAHSGINRILLCSLLGRPLSEKKQVPQGYAAINVLTYSNGVWHAKDVGILPEDWTGW
ncbi:MAG: histidine phosphatase family protein [Clostridia bacterium]|nr:histidine phosphatase family protein [Clostridia bacterium]